jgi:shikimate dehydrogenase
LGFYHEGRAKLTAKAIVAGVIGWPVAHSLSPALHNFWLRALDLDGAYVPLPVRPENFSTALHGLRAAGFSGVNVTAPHKEAAFALAHEMDAAGAAAGAANLLLFRGERIVARNTDVEGLRTSLLEALGTRAVSNQTVVILGAGGAARAAALACDQLKPREIVFLNRTPRRAEALAAALAHSVTARLTAASLAQWPQVASSARLAINATSAGLEGMASVALALDVLPRDAAVCDLVYSPLETPFLAEARTAGLATIDGLGMLIHQGVPSFEALFGIRPQVTRALRRYLKDELRRAS